MIGINRKPNPAKPRPLSRPQKISAQTASQARLLMHTPSCEKSLSRPISINWPMNTIRSIRTTRKKSWNQHGWVWSFSWREYVCTKKSDFTCTGAIYWCFAVHIRHGILRLLCIIFHQKVRIFRNHLYFKNKRTAIKSLNLRFY